MTRIRKNTVNRLLLYAALSTALPRISSITLADATWDASGSSFINPTDGSGVWSTSIKNWAYNSSYEQGWSNSTSGAIFGNNHGVAGAVTLGSPVQVYAVTFNNASGGNYTIAGTANTSIQGLTTITVNGSLSPTISANIVSTNASLTTVAGSGSVTLSGSNTLSGGVIVNSGTLKVGSANALGAGPVTVNTDAALDVIASASLPDNPVTSINNGTFTIEPGQIFNSDNFNQSAGVLAVNGSFDVSSATFYDFGGTITGNPIAFNTSGAVGFGPSAAPANFTFSGPSVNASLLTSTNIPAGTVVSVQPSSSSSFLQIYAAANYGHITVTSANGSSSAVESTSGSGLVNHGIITIAANGTPSGAASIALGVVTNATDGTLNFNSNAQLSEMILNYGSVNVAASETLTINSLYAVNQSAGTLTINGSLNTGGGTFYQAGGNLVINGSLNMSGSQIGGIFYDLGGTITGNAVSFLGAGMVVFGPTPAAANFVFTGSTLTAYLNGSNASVNIPSNAFITMTSLGIVYPTITTPANYGNITLTSGPGRYSQISITPTNFTNHGVITIANSVVPAYGPASTSPGFINAADGTFNINSPTQLSSALVNSGTVAIAATATLDLQTYGLNISGGSITLAANSNSPATVNLTSVYWPATGTAATAAAISTTGTTSTTAGKINLGATASTPFDLENGAATLTVSADITNGGINKLGLGTLILSGPNLYAGTTTVSAGTLTLAKGASLASTQITVAAGATFNDFASAPNATLESSGPVTFAAINGSTPNIVQLKTLSIPASTVDTLDYASNHSARTLLALSTLSLLGTTTSSLDMTDNDLSISGMTYATIYPYVQQGFVGGNWTGKGINSSAAAVDTTHLTTLGIIQNSTQQNASGPALYGSGTALGLFDGSNPTASTVLVKYTYYGDTNLDGKVDSSDYSEIDSGFLSNGTQTGWYNGDFNYDGVVNGSDYTLIDNAFNSQGVRLSTELVLAASTTEIDGSTSSVPEPTTLGVMLCSIALLRRRNTI